MSKLVPVNQRKRDTDIQTVDANEIQPLEPNAPRGFFRFSYSVTEVSAHGPTAHVKSRRVDFEDGKLRSESFEGDMERGAYDRMASQTQQLFAAQAALWMRSLSWLLPRTPRDRD